MQKVKVQIKVKEFQNPSTCTLSGSWDCWQTISHDVSMFITEKLLFDANSNPGF